MVGYSSTTISLSLRLDSLAMRQHKGLLLSLSFVVTPCYGGDLTSSCSGGCTPGNCNRAYGFTCDNRCTEAFELHWSGFLMKTYCPPGLLPLVCHPSRHQLPELLRVWLSQPREQVELFPRRSLYDRRPQLQHSSTVLSLQFHSGTHMQPFHLFSHYSLSLSSPLLKLRHFSP